MNNGRLVFLYILKGFEREKLAMKALQLISPEWNRLVAVCVLVLNKLFSGDPLVEFVTKGRLLRRSKKDLIRMNRPCPEFKNVFVI